ncbi:MAG: EAL domain-containing protein [Acidimicrobiales bacterium]|nr:EAL domain-containing protein [Acidimicrobiales bacterium]
MAKRLALLLLLPLLVMGGFAASFARGVRSEPLEAGRAAAIADVTLAIGDLTDALDIEALVSAIYVDSPRPEPNENSSLFRGKSVRESQTESDQRLALAWERFGAAGGSWPTSVRNQVGEALATVESLMAARQQIVDRERSGLQVRDRYAYVNSLLSEALEAQLNLVETGELAGEMASYDAIVRARSAQMVEQITIESALHAGSWLDGALNVDAIEAAIGQAIGISQAANVLGTEAALTTLRPRASLQEIRNMIRVGIEPGDLGLTPGEWRSMANDWRIELEGGVGASQQQLQKSVNRTQSQGWSDSNLAVGAAIALSVGTILFAGFMANLMLTRIRETRDQMVAFAQSGGQTPLSVSGRDELADMAESFGRLAITMRETAASDARLHGIVRDINDGHSREEVFLAIGAVAADQLGVDHTIVVDDPKNEAAHAVRRPGDEHPSAWIVPGGGIDSALDELRDPVMEVCSTLTALVLQRDWAEQRMTYQDTHDSLTGLANQMVLLDEIERVSATSDVTSLGVLRFSLQGLLEVNEAHDRATGDRTLIEAAERIRKEMGPGAVVARLSGGEFGCLAAGMPTEVSAIELGERVLDALSDPFLANEFSIDLTSAAGVVVSAAGADPHTLLEQAEMALSKAQTDDVGHTVLFEESMSEWLDERRRTADDLDVAIDNGELELWYQPVFGVGGGLRGFEGLVRWNRPGEGIVSPGYFLPVAEEYGLISRLGLWVLETGCRQIRTWVDSDISADISLSLNVSGTELTQPDFSARVAEILDRTGAPADHLIIEVTEKVLLANQHGGRTTLAELDELGVHISIDNFGSGYSSLSYLRELPISSLKIDRLFIEDVVHSEEVQAIVAAIVGLAEALDMDVAAQGIEGADQLRKLAELGCDLAQGYLLGRPMTGFAATNLYSGQTADTS